MLTSRQKTILDTIIEQYISSAAPISSQAVFEISNLDVSCPTIRNEMADLTDMGYLAQPHTSAGRVPTEQAYRLFVDSLIDKYARHLKRKVRQNAGEIAREVSEHVNDVVMFVGADGQLKYIGLRKLFSNPEFKAREDIVALIEELDRFEGAIDDALERVSDITGQMEVFIGSENPFFEREEYSIIVSPLEEGFISLLGPTRMNYRRNLSILEKFL